MLRRMISLLIYIGIPALLVFSGCSNKRWKGGSDGDGRKRPASVLAEVVPMEISMQVYKEHLNRGSDLNRARLIEIFSRNQTNETYQEFRFFDIQKGSVYWLLGMRTGDVLLSANEFVVPNAQTFWQYLNLLQFEEQAQIEILRSGKPFLFKYQFVE